MSGAGLALDGTIAFAALATLAFGLFALAIRVGRWPLWLAGYTAAALAVAAAAIQGAA
ncbi:MAG: hypothetical protein P8177_13545 [Gemmatimonadota bacterium]